MACPMFLEIFHIHVLCRICASQILPFPPTCVSSAIQVQKWDKPHNTYFCIARLSPLNGATFSEFFMSTGCVLLLQSSFLWFSLKDLARVKRPRFCGNVLCLLLFGASGQSRMHASLRMSPAHKLALAQGYVLSLSGCSAQGCFKEATISDMQRD